MTEVLDTTATEVAAGTRSLRTARLAIVVICTTLPLEHLVVVPGAGPITDLALLVGALLGAAALTRGLRIPRPDAFVGLLVLFVSWALLTSFWSLDPAKTIGRSVTYLSMLLLAGLLWALLRDRASVTLAIQAYVLGVAIVVLDVLRNWLTGANAVASDETARFAAGISNPNRTAAMIVVGFVLACYLVRRDPPRGWRRVIDLFLIVVGPVALVLTGSRGALVAMVPVTAFLVGGALVRFLRGRPGGVVALVAAGLALVVVTPASSVDRLTQWSAEEERIGSGSIQVRETAVDVGMRAFWGRPFTGYGAGSFGTLMEERSGAFVVAHNTIVSVLVELGLIGAAIFALLWLFGLVQVARSSGPDRSYGIVLFLTILSLWSSASMEHYKMTWIVLVLLVVMALPDGRPHNLAAEAPAPA